MQKRGPRQDARAMKEPSYADPEMQKIANQIVDLRNRESTAGVPVHELFNNSFLLSAQLGDARRKSRGQEQILVNAYKDAWNDKNVQAMYDEGKNGDVSKKGEYREQSHEEEGLKRFVKENPDLFKPGSYDDN